jgi:sec-independent protein translocase protein TatC
MSFVEHLEELRHRLLSIILALLGLSIAGYFLGSPVLKFLARPVDHLYFFTPTEALIARIKLALMIGLILALPFILYELYRFVTPGLTPKERRYFGPLLFAAYLLFLIGGAFGLFVILPIGVRVLLSFAPSGVGSMINLSRYLSFALGIVGFLGLLFQLPLIVLFLTRIGLVTPETLKRHRKTAIVIIFILGAIITPTVDFITLLLLALPLLLLYELSLWLANRFRPKRQ